ncbi:hypothetical protein CTI12_AA313410 [Artemisia annua]|uniref:Glabrous enhancer-binding protein-like DBD domain-containing protein n=1 Tax=Artemisia annua TaxID=35608 RepID=A0A2U1N380_ARTAN|nr:hypothetical protein CTI12_AA313410 [Artemisia annua]
MTVSVIVRAIKLVQQRLWTDEDEIELLQGYYDYITTRGLMTSSSHHHHDTTAFYDEIKGKLQLEFNKNQLVEKLRRLKKKYRNVDENVAFNLNENNNGDVHSLEKKRPRKRSRSGGVKIEEGYVQPQQQFETVKSCLLPLFKELVSSSANGGSRGLGSGLGGMGLDMFGGGAMSFGIGDMSDEKWRKQHILEMEVYLKRLELMQDQVKSRLDELKSMGS